MSHRRNEFGQAIGDPVPGWESADWPQRTPIAGKYCDIEPLDADRHLEDLYIAFSEDAEGRLWTYMTSGPFHTIEEFSVWLRSASESKDPHFYTVVDTTTGMAVGLLAYMRIKPEVGVVEIGTISYSPRLQRTRMATEAIFLTMKRAFDELGFRRYEWKCDSLNEASCRAAVRFGFKFEGIFRQAIVYKGRNRDTAWYSILDSEWPVLKRAYSIWLDSDNFDGNGQQKRRLQDIIEPQRTSHSGKGDSDD